MASKASQLLAPPEARLQGYEEKLYLRLVDKYLSPWEKIVQLGMLTRKVSDKVEQVTEQNVSEK